DSPVDGPLRDGGGDGMAPGDGGLDGSGDSGLSAPLAKFCQDYANAVCNGRRTCGFLDLPPLADCLTSEVGRCTQSLQSIAGAFSSGRLVYDAAAAATCFSKGGPPAFCISSGTLGYGVPECQGVFKGTVADGGTCYAQYTLLLAGGGDSLDECASGTTCSANFQSCPGQCVADVATGGACSMTGGPRCAAGDYCNGTTCAAYGAVGSACDGPTDKCGVLLACGTHDADGAFTCETKKESGAACSFDAECDDLACLTGTCRPAHLGETCAPWGKCDTGSKCSRSGCVAPIAVNGACTPDYDTCDTGLVCETTGTDDAGLVTGLCHALQSRTAGQPCFNGACDPSAWCDTSPAQPICRAPGMVGQLCAGGTAGSCATGLACDGTTGKCQVPGTTGGSCDPLWSSTCAAGYGCGPAMTCEPKVGAGAACDGSGVCPTNYYCSGTCKPAKLPGAACSGIDGECLGGACDTVRNTCNGDCVDPG
ncbi:MAG: hypothetical protein ACRENE_00710, partial [Polyangiaceae bacterium]